MALTTAQKATVAQVAPSGQAGLSALYESENSSQPQAPAASGSSRAAVASDYVDPSKSLDSPASSNGAAGGTGKPVSSYGGAPVPVIKPAVTPAATGASATGGAAPAVGSQESQEDIYAKYLAENEGAIESIQSAAEATVAQDSRTGSEAESNQNASAAASGLLGSSAMIEGANRVAGDTNTKNASTRANAAVQISGILTDLQKQAQTQANYERGENLTEEENAFSENQTNRQNFLSSIGGLAQHGINWKTFSTDPAYVDSYKSLVSMAGDPGTAEGLFTMSIPAANVISSQMSPDGKTYYQLSQVPGQTPQMTSYTLPEAIPQGWTSVKVGTTGVMFYNPSDPSKNITYTTNPLTGEITAGGSNAPQSQNNNGDTSSTTPSGGGYIMSVANGLGVDPSTPLSDVIANQGLGAVTAQIINAEGGSLKGVSNNPGNIKYYLGLANATDSGVKATDDPNGKYGFASFDTKANGEAAIASIINEAASGKSSSYGTSPTLQTFLTKYGNLGTNATPAGLDTRQYGLLANVPGFDPTGKKSDAPAGYDSAAWNYLNQYLTQGKTPSAASVGISTRAGSGPLFNSIAQRADDVYFKATGEHLPDADILEASKKLITGNNQLLNTLNVQEKTINKNFGLSLDNLNSNNINKNAPAINGFIDDIRYALGDPNVAQYLSQNETLQNEAASLLALKNASGTTVADKLSAAGLIAKNASVDDQVKVLKTLMTEAQNARVSIGQASEQLYGQIDPLGLNPNNPANTPGYQEMKDAGATNNYDGTYTLNGQTVKVNADGTVTPQ